MDINTVTVFALMSVICWCAMTKMHDHATRHCIHNYTGIRAVANAQQPLLLFVNVVRLQLINLMADDIPYLVVDQV